MYEDMMKNFSEQFEPSLNSVRKLADLTLDHAEKMTKFQIEASRSYFELGLEQARGALKVSDAESLQNYVSSQQGTANTLSQKLSSDAQKLAEMGKDFSEAAGKVAQDSAASAQEKARENAKKAA